MLVNGAGMLCADGPAGSRESIWRFDGGGAVMHLINVARG
jgi:hypothetical protein